MQNRAIFLRYNRVVVLCFACVTMFVCAPGVSAETCNNGNGSSGTVILDNTAIPGVSAINTNLKFLSGCGKGDTTIKTGYGGNAININNFQNVGRDLDLSPDGLKLIVGATEETVDDDNFGADGQINYFTDGEHLFDLERLRATAEWLSESGNISPDSEVLPGTYGSISFSQFLINISNNRTMYGIVRVKIGLEKGQRNDCSNDCDKNSSGKTVADSGDIYGFCRSGNWDYLCECAPRDGFKIKEGSKLCGVDIPADAKIKVKGSLLWDFVDYETQEEISLDKLPFAPRELYFKVEIPIMVNWDHDADDDGAMDNMPVIKSITAGASTGAVVPVPSIDFNDISQSTRDNYEYLTGNVLSSSSFIDLSDPDQYHMLMSSGYADGWAEAFDKLNITANTWSSLPPDECVLKNGSRCAKYTVPNGVTGVMVANDVRNGGFEDIPAYLYSGGLIDMHDHVNISGLLYVPQALELEAKNSNLPTQQYISGAVVVRDGFYIEAKQNTITVLSADPSSYSTAKVKAAGASFVFEKGGPGADYNQGNTGLQTGSGNVTDEACFGCGSANASSTGAAGGNSGSISWVEIRPQ